MAHWFGAWEGRAFHVGLVADKLHAAADADIADVEVVGRVDEPAHLAVGTVAERAVEWWDFAVFDGLYVIGVA